ncbi:uncharacterized protein zgc:193726 isoform X2 [Seriola aureovittata]|uniref:uncharacterized protein zgc:193726 isoform X2 n=1 Tax=Seriola aureovittata TaxID=2871759 RepID=UPI0024BE8E91|nr:uncharacterized protein zgc:193726 isoform X2 [Seriola aureovittata]
MKSLLSVALFLMIMMMMLMASVSAGPLPPSLNQTRHDDQDTESFHLLQNKEENSTRFESRQNINVSLDVTSNGSWSNARPVPPVVIRNALHGCFLPTCLTVNLGSSLQVGDETAGGATSDAFGIGKK